jgi:site-specific DNA-methyltransferase (adenine-specific)/site-specific DNA-methyltransferase (cytosine-N4-specific)
MIDIRTGDCFELIKDLPDNSVDLVITSPPYADIVNYGKDISIKKPNEYCDWLLPLLNEIYRVLKPSGSFILNINDNCSKGLRNPFIYELIYRSQKETNMKFYDTYIWHKMNGIPNGSTKRFRNNTEFIFHFVKNQKELKFHMDRVLQEPKEETQKSIKYLTGSTNKTKEGYVLPNNKRELPELVRPDNVFRFPTAGASRDNHIKHPAPFHKDLPTYFINLLTDEGDVILDVFSGIGTTGLGCENRDYIGFEMNEKYAEFSRKRLLGEELEQWLVCQYDMNDNLIACYKNRDEASRATGIESGDIMRTYNRTKFESRGGFKWKLVNPRIYQYDMNDKLVGIYQYWSEVSKKYNVDTESLRVDGAMIRLNGYINKLGYKWKLGEELEQWLVCQYDMNDNLIACYKNRDEASKATGVESGDIMRTYNRTKFESRGGFKWKLERNDIINQYDLEGNFIQTFNTLLEIENYFGKPCVNNIKNILRGYKRNFTLWDFEWKLEQRLND